MKEEENRRDITERLELIESMIAEGRRTAESWGWTFLLWGVAFYVAIAWSAWGHRLGIWGQNGLAWLVTMPVAFALTVVIASRKGRRQPLTTVARAIISLWVCAGISMFLLFTALSISGRLDPHSFVALIGAMLGIANGASSMILKWRAQLVCAAVWWATSVVGCFGSDAHVAGVFLAAVFVCQIVFGVYAMICEARRKQVGVAHA